MKKSNVILAFSLFVVTLLVSSCSDDEPKSKTELLTSKGWSFSAVALKTSTTEFSVTDEFISDCEKDNVLTFTKEGIYIDNVGADDCDGDSSNETGTWAWKSNETILSITTDDDAEEVTLISINSSTLKIDVGKMPYDLDGDGIDESEVSVIYTLTAK